MIIRYSSNISQLRYYEGKEAGSWAPDMADSFEVHGGRLYVTCLSIYMLEVYYRHLPIYTKIYPSSMPVPGTGQ